MTTSISSNLGLGTAIIQVLRRYGDVSEDFLIDRLNQEPTEMREYLHILAKKGIIKRRDRLVGLVADQK